MYFRSPLYELQKASGSVFQSYDYLSYELPSHFGSAEKEYAALNESCTIIDFSYYGYLKITGKHALDFLNRMSTNDLKKLNENKCAATVLTNDKGRIIDLIRVSRRSDGLYITTSPQCGKKIIQWLDKYIIMDDVRLQSLSAQTIHLGLMGPRSAEILKALFGTEPPEHDQVAEFFLSGQPILVSPSHQLDNGFIMTANVSIKQELWELLNAHTIPLCGMDAYFAARIEQKKPIMGNELSEKYNPLEAGLQNTISFTKGCYIGQEVIARLDSYDKIQRHLVQMKSREPIPEGAKIFSDNKEIGIVTSSTHSYKYGLNIALGYVKTEFINSAAVWINSTSEKKIQAEFCP